MDTLPPENTELGSLANPAGTGLGSLAQSARSKKLKQARGILIAVGVLTLILNGIVLALLVSQKNKIDNEVKRLRAQPNMVVNESKVKEAQDALRSGFLVTGVALGLGFIFVILGLIVKQYPVPATLLGLVLYIGATVIFGLMNPETLSVVGIIVKIVFIACLVKALQAGIAYEKERAKERAALETGM